MIGSYIGFFVLTWCGGAADPSLPIALVIVLIFLGAMLGAGLLGITIERFAYRPLREKRASRIAPLISALGVSFFLQQLAVICFGATPKQYDAFSFDGGSFFTSVSIGPFEIPVHAAVRHHDHGLPHGRAHDLHRAHAGGPGDAGDVVRSRGRDR
jgi:branched-chain amino acid transport system permease protein